MKQTWNSDTIDSMICRIENLEGSVKQLVSAGDDLAGCLPSEKDWYEALEVWEAAKTLSAGVLPANPYARLAAQFEGIDYSAIRCPVCGAKMASHAKDHLCRMHRNSSGVCVVCNDPFKTCVCTLQPCTGMDLGGCSVECRGNAHF